MKNVLIKCKNISKSFDNKKVIDNFNYNFYDNSLYLIYGESGCGKTTLLNILSGTIAYDSGIIEINNNKFSKQISEIISKNNIAYITQNCYFIDYLNVYDNLKLVIQDKKQIEEIDKYLQLFNIEQLKYKFPNQISGGERQRVALIRALLKHNSIIILDEPTASLDEDNKKIILNILNKLKHNHLIICATHDEDLKSIADDIITFPFDNINDISSNNQTKELSLKNDKKNKIILFPYMLKQYIYKENNKKSAFYLSIALIVCFLIIFFCYDSKTKVEKSLLEYNKVNFVQLYCNVKVKDYCESKLKDAGAISSSYDYRENDLIFYDEDLSGVASDKYLKNTLPFDENIFPLKDKIIYGKYFENENDVIIGIDAAKELSDNIENLINSSIELNIFGKIETFRIVGILDDVTNSIYMEAMFNGVSNYYIYMNSKYMEQFKSDKRISLSVNNYNGIYLHAYFDNVDKLYTFLKDNEDSFRKNGELNTDYEISTVPFDFNFIKYSLFITSVKTYLTPTVIIVFLASLLFYFQIEYIKNYYQKHILAVYNYYGFSWINIFINCIITTIIYISIIYLISFILSIILSNILNIIFMKNHFVSFILFLTDYTTIRDLYLVLIVLSIVMSLINTFFLKKKGWLLSLSEGDDLL